ncbi:MAG: hypothetical protein VCA39_19045 [Pseudomonas sp.]|uniref:hypothetical protein n=1 Tax=Pseudomonas sp. TaxID=306 RepID=UPI003981AA37
MAGYIWLPVYTDFLPDQTKAGALGLKSMAVQWNSGRLGKAKSTYRIINTPFESGIRKGIYRGIFGGCLASLNVKDKLYILLHGISSPGQSIATHVGATRFSGSSKYYTPAELAILMKKEGLDINFLNISVYACDSGVGGWDSFACKLMLELRAIGYSRICVTGYKGEVNTSYALRYEDIKLGTITKEPHKGLVVSGRGCLRASKNKIKFPLG